MLLMQEPELLLVDEPVAGMTPQETERTAELLVSLAGDHSVVVVEHDMDFVRSIARRVTVLHEGQRAGARQHGRRAERSARHRSVSGDMSVLSVTALNQFYGGSHTLVGRQPRRARGIAHVPDGPQRHGQDHAAQVHHGTAARGVGRDRVRRPRSSRAAARSTGAPRHRLRAAGPRDFPAAHRRRKPARWASGSVRGSRTGAPRRAHDSAEDLRPVSGAEDDAAAGAAAIFPAASNSSSRSAARSCSSRRC